MAVGRKPEVARRGRAEGAGPPRAEGARAGVVFPAVPTCPPCCAVLPPPNASPALNNDRFRADVSFIRSSNNDFQNGELKNLEAVKKAFRS